VSFRVTGAKKSKPARMLTPASKNKYKRCRSNERQRFFNNYFSADKARIDFTWPENLKPLFPELTASAKALIALDA